MIKPTSRMTQKLFDRYLFADYSGGGEHHRAQGNIRLYLGIGDREPIRLENTYGRNFSRDTLRIRIIEELKKATKESERVIFGLDHQYSWPTKMWEQARLCAACWRTAVAKLRKGDGERPALDIPVRFCRKFNNFAGERVFWSPLRKLAALYGIGTTRPQVQEADRFRLTERQKPFQGGARPKPADCVGGRGEGIVGGQTICGLYHIADLLLLDAIKWWPFDGLSIRDQIYAGKHVAIEIYPSALRPPDVPQCDDNDARHSCLYVRDKDRSGKLPGLMDLSGLGREYRAQVSKEGWILGMNPALLALKGAHT
jgi:hypothetical protein